MNITIFDIYTGQILRVTSIPVGMASIQLTGPDEDWLEGHWPDDRFYVENFTAVEMPPRPSEHHQFNYTTKQWVDPRTAETEWPLVRAKRNQLLTQSDWTQLPDVPISTKEAWAIYRQALRDVTLQPDPFNITWPTPP